MHAFIHNDITIHHDNSIHSTGNVRIYVDGAFAAEVPQKALVAFVADLVRNERISRLEQAHDLGLLGLPG